MDETRKGRGKNIPVLVTASILRNGGGDPAPGDGKVRGERRPVATIQLLATARSK
jgi:hypothetical protein